MTTRSEMLLSFSLDIHSKIISEVEYAIGFRHIQGNNPTDATVETTNLFDPIFNTIFDALFGERRNPNNPFDPLETISVLESGRLEPLRPLVTTIIRDVIPELDECYTINIFEIDTVTDGGRVNYDCNENEDNPEDFFCDHTVCIVDDDG